VEYHFGCLLFIEGFAGGILILILFLILITEGTVRGFGED
jgi:hypothetical protein